WSWQIGLIIGLSISVASTVVVVRVLTDNGIVNTLQGRIAIGWLVVEDVFTVIILILLPTIASVLQGESYSFMTILEAVAIVLGKFAVLTLFMFTWGHQVVSYLLTNIARLRSHELFTLATLAIVFMIAVGSSLIFGTSIALGAFIAGMVIAKTSVKHQAAANSLPLKDIFAIIFFISIGMIFNPHAILENFSLFVGVLAVILVIKPIVAFLVANALKCSLKVALTVAILLAQIGEFSFILAEQTMSLKILSDEAFDIIVACALVSISLNPLLFQLVDPMEAKVQKIAFSSRFKMNPLGQGARDKKQHSKVVIVGFGLMGKELLKLTRGLGFSPTIIEDDIDTVADHEAEDPVIFGDPSQFTILKDAQVADASHLFITTSNIQKTLEVVRTARQINPMIQIVAHLQKISEIPYLEGLKIHYICAESEDLKAFTALTRHLLQPQRRHRSLYTPSVQT
ncbi:MAG: cation:proton antiporter domain-containing protein, partial [Parachlamydiaceae bacterium]